MSTMVACQPDPPVTPPVTPTGPQTVWTLGDSQGALSNDPARGLPWTLRIGNDVGNGADAMYGAGWQIPGSYSLRSVPQRASDLTAVNVVDEFIVMAGINDLTGGRTVAEMLAGVDQLSFIAAAEGADVLWVGVVPLPQAATISNREADRLAFNAALASRFPGRYVDCSPSMSTTGGWLQPGYSLGPLDLHLNSAGEQALADCVAAAR